MEMTIKDRLYLPALLPDKGNYREFNLKKGHSAENSPYGCRTRGGGPASCGGNGPHRVGHGQGDAPVADFSREELDYLREACEKLSEKTLPDDMWATVERIFDNCQAE